MKSCEITAMLYCVKKKDEKIRKELQEMAFDAQIEGTEAQKNSFLAPAPKVPKIDVEIAESQGKTVGLEELPPSDKDTKPLDMVNSGLPVGESLKEYYSCLRKHSTIKRNSSTTYGTESHQMVLTAQRL